MPTDLDIPSELIERARALGGHRTGTAAVMTALEEYVRRFEQQRVLELFGTIDYDTDYDYKADRSRR